MEKQLKETIDMMVNVFRDKSDKKHMDWVKNVIEEYHYLDIKDPEKFALLVSLTAESQIDLLSRIALSDMKIDKENKYKIKFVYTEYGFIERHLKSIILKYEGHGCSTDKTRWLIDSYAHYLMTGKQPVIEERKYWHPRVINVGDWMTYMKTIQELYYGQDEDYTKAKEVLANAYIQLISKEYSKLNQKWVGHEYYLQVRDEEEKKHYEFVHPETQDKGTVILNERCEIAYRFYLEKEQRFITRKDTVPEWFEQLIKQ